MKKATSSLNFRYYILMLLFAISLILNGFLYFGVVKPLQEKNQRLMDEVNAMHLAGSHTNESIKGMYVSMTDWSYSTTKI
jgi:hypothetical protein